MAALAEVPAWQPVLAFCRGASRGARLLASISPWPSSVHHGVALAGDYDTEEAAAVAFDRATICKSGYEHAQTNFPKESYKQEAAKLESAWRLRVCLGKGQLRAAAGGQMGTWRPRGAADSAA